MIEAAKEKIKRIATRARLAVEATVVLIIAAGWFAVQTGHMKADIEFPGVSLGGGTSSHASRDQQLAAISGALPLAAVSPTPAQSRSRGRWPGR